jgi:outer membrane translocation and assembly module TamA
MLFKKIHVWHLRALCCLWQLQQEKHTAVQDEDYDEAKRLKSLIERLKVIGEQIKQLELKKCAAVEAEDYDAAKLCKVSKFISSQDQFESFHVNPQRNKCQHITH